jgi:putative ABC transport system substrate-binding protein
VTDLVHPEGNITGILLGDYARKRLELLLEIVPTTQRIFIPYNPTDIQSTSSYEDVIEFADEFGLEIVTREIRNEKEFPQAFLEIPNDIDAIFLLEDRLVSGNTTWSEIAQEKQIPLVAPAVITGERQGYDILMGYGMDLPALGKQAARIAAQILSGTPIKDIPIQTAEAFLLINLDFANAVGIEVPEYILARANVIRRASDGE